MDALDNILLRNSARSLTLPHPTEEEMETVYKAALRAPDHAWLRPSRFIQVTGEGLNKLSEIFVEYAKENIDDVAPETLEKYKSAPFRAPMVIILVTNVTEHPKVPEIEQMLSSATAGQNILLALNALNYSAIWRTGIFAFNEMVSQRMGLEENQKIIGYLYVGTSEGKVKNIPELDPSDYVTEWS